MHLLVEMGIIGPFCLLHVQRKQFLNFFFFYLGCVETKWIVYFFLTWSTFALEDMHHYVELGTVC